MRISDWSSDVCSSDLEDLIAYSALGLGGADHAEMAAALRLDRDSFGHLASCMVATRWRQRGLHQWLIDRRIAYGLRRGLRHFAAMVSPYNDASWSNLKLGRAHV